MIGKFKMLRFKELINTLIIFLGLLSLSIFLTVNLSWLLYLVAVGYFHLEMISGKSGTSLMKCYFFMVKYLEIPWDVNLRLVFFKASAKGLHHFKDVKDLIVINNVCMILFNGLSLKLIRRLKVIHSMWTLIGPFKMVFTALALLVSLALIDFQQFFINLHRILFRNRDWVFNVNTDPVIKVLPMPYFGWCFVLFALILITLILVLIIRLNRINKDFYL